MSGINQNSLYGPIQLCLNTLPVFIFFSVMSFLSACVVCREQNLRI